MNQLIKKVNDQTERKEQAKTETE